MRINTIKQSESVIKQIKNTRCILSNIETSNELTEFERDKRRFELCRAIDLLKSDLIDIIERELNEPENLLKKSA